MAWFSRIFASHNTPQEVVLSPEQLQVIKAWQLGPDTISAELMVENVARLTRRHMIVFVTFRDEELESLRAARPQTAGDVSRAVIAHQLLHERDIVLTRLRRMGVHIVNTTREQLGPELVRAYDELRRRERV